ncbi:MAG: prolyl oligopeptidase family serine peptidase [Prevotella sp.]|nr:prolyl oligopeptidase family serine peptidase [Prevotella sp.]MCM1075274.1 prolyl oligopeptidase family serine peptidase [Ruminococcus sp.]
MKAFILALAAATVVSAGAKKPLDHDAFDSWTTPRTLPLSNNGVWATYTLNPQEGDGKLVFRNTAKGTEIVVNRGYNPQISADAKFAAALIKPFYADTRKAKIDKKKDFDLPQDSLAIINLTTGKVEKIANVSSFKMGKDGGNTIAWLSSDTTYITPKALKDKKSGQPLLVRQLAGGNVKIIPWVKGYEISRLGERLAAYTMPHSSDSTAVDKMVLLNLPDTEEYTLLQNQKYYGAPVFSRQGDKLAFTASTDSAETGTRKCNLYYASLNTKTPSAQEMYVLKAVNEGKMPHIMRPNTSDPTKRDSIYAEMHKKMTAMAGDSLFLNQYTKPTFSYSGDRLIVGVAPYVAPDDTTIVDFEQPQLDIWRWDAPYTPPQEKSALKELQSQTFPIVIDIDGGKEVLLTSSDLEVVVPSYRWDGEWVLVRDAEPTVVSRQWNYLADEDLYIVNVKTGERRKVGKAPQDNSEISPEGKYVAWFNDRNYYVYDIATGQTACVSEDIEVPLWDEEQDVPMARLPYGIMGWSKGDNALLVYDKHDIWSLDPKGKNAPVNLTKGAGRKANYRYRFVKTDPEQINFAPGDELLLDVFDFTSKENGLATMKAGTPAAPSVKTLEKYKFTQIRKAKDAPVYEFCKSNFNTTPEVYISKGTDFKNAKVVTDANPQRKDYSWGDAQLVKWYAFDGKLTEGVLYTPEDLDPNKKYPMLVVFYETNSEELYRHYTMEPSWSWVNYPFYVSRGYVVFVPDVHYTPGIPGEGAYNCIVSGVEYLCDKYKFIDKDKIGIDGQSWGGYQTAYLITRTNMFACAGSGAPVSNMTSAFGGIRWGTGDSRQAQYEMGQSRIGRNLWEAPELYIANSPLFKADRVNTPLLIMHNDDDGAVPWYQGIEYFMALRRLGKPVWMLQYNGEAHNIKARKNRKDITHRLQEFFDYYLKGGKMPRWMKEGIPMTRKGQELRYGPAED